ncbi:MAG: hypothetical protein HZB81_04480 [Deltaproteobacteria bacterium]|nr:hypothetical protein [Deltaproteobacteria bacterium]
MRVISFFAFFILLIIAAAASFGYADDNNNNNHAQPEKQEIITRTIRIEGSPEKPRVIFIVPKARLWDVNISHKSFLKELLEPAYPGLSIAGSGSKK